MSFCQCLWSRATRSFLAETWGHTYASAHLDIPERPQRVQVASLQHTVHTHTQRAARGLGKPRFMEKHSRQGLPAVYLPHTHHLHQYPHTLNEAYFPKPPHIAHLCTCVMSLHFISRTAMERHQPPSCMSVWRCVFVSDSKVSSQLMANTTANRTPIHTKWFILETQLQHNSVNLL